MHHMESLARMAMMYRIDYKRCHRISWKLPCPAMDILDTYVIYMYPLVQETYHRHFTEPKCWMLLHGMAAGMLGGKLQPRWHVGAETNKQIPSIGHL